MLFILSIFQSVNQLQYYQNQSYDQIEYIFTFFHNSRKFNTILCSCLNCIYDIISCTSPSYAQLSQQPTAGPYIGTILYFVQLALSTV